MIDRMTAVIFVASNCIIFVAAAYSAPDFASIRSNAAFASVNEVYTVGKEACAMSAVNALRAADERDAALVQKAPHATHRPKEQTAVPPDEMPQSDVALHAAGAEAPLLVARQYGAMPGNGDAMQMPFFDVQSEPQTGVADARQMPIVVSHVSPRATLQPRPHALAGGIAIHVLK